MDVTCLSLVTGGLFIVGGLIGFLLWLWVTGRPVPHNTMKDLKTYYDHEDFL